MTRSTARWTTAIAAAAMLALPASGLAQATLPSPQQETGQPAAAEAQPASSAHEHIQRAAAALDDIPTASLTGTAKSRVTELEEHVGKLEQAAAAGVTRGAMPGAAAAQTGAGWAAEVAAADGILTELLGKPATSGASEKAGTAGTTTSAVARGETPTAVTLDENTRARLQSVRTHLTAFAAAMRGGGPTPSADDPAAPASASGVSRGEAAAAPRAPATESGSTASATQGTPGAANAAGAAGAQTGTAGTSGTQPPESASPPPQAGPDNAKRHLSAARESLSSLTQLPAASQLTGDARAQVSQLISSFNELIATTEWRPAFAKVQSNLNTLLGDQRADESAAPTAGAAGAVGTTGGTPIDPAIREKLVEFRTHMAAFERAASGGGAPESAAAAPANPTSTPGAASAAPTHSAGATAQAPAQTGTSGTTASTPAPASTSGPPAAATAATPSDTQAQAAGHQQALEHIDAIAAIVGGGASGNRSPAPDAAGAANQGTTLTAAQIAEIQTHLEALRTAIRQSAR
jgi:hypothetical protein